MKLNAKQLRITRPTPSDFAKIRRKPIHIILDNVMDTYNIGSIFRLADAMAAEEIILCAGSETPPSSRIHKAAVGTEEWVPWRYFSLVEDAIKSLKAQIPEIQIVVVEQDDKAVSFTDFVFSSVPMALVVGHETEGVSESAKKLADVIVEIPMFGVNKSLNVVVSTGIVLYSCMTNG